MHETIIELSSTVRIHMREFTLGSASEMTYIVSGGALNSTHSLTHSFTLGPLSDSRPAPGGHQLVGQAENLTFESTCIGCYYRTNIRPSPFVIVLNHEVDTHLPSLGGWKAEST